MTLMIDRSVLFHPGKFFGLESWKILEQDANSLALSNIDISRIQFIPILLQGNEAGISGEENLIRLKQLGYISLDTQILWTIWRNQSILPKLWKQSPQGNCGPIHFEGTILAGPGGHRCVFFLYCLSGHWAWDISYLTSTCVLGCESAVLIPV